MPGPAVCARILATFGFVCATWVLFRAQTLGDAASILAKIASEVTRWSAWHTALGGMDHPVAVVGLVLVEWLQRRRPLPLALPRLPGSVRLAAYTGLVWYTLWLAPARSGPFIYFQF
jgi:hypothetical protein